MYDVYIVNDAVQLICKIHRYKDSTLLSRDVRT